MSRHKNAFIERLTNEGSFRRSSGPLWQPSVDIYRCPEGWKIKFDLAGVKPEDVQVLIADDRLIVRGVRRDGVITEGWSYYQLEITYSRFERVLQIPCDLSVAEINVESRDGWLLVHIDCNDER
jgi:HSP20 family protein